MERPAIREVVLIILGVSSATNIGGPLYPFHDACQHLEKKLGGRLAPLK
jgi:hypothetical protein